MLTEIEVRRLPRRDTAVIRRRITPSEADRIPGWIAATLAAVRRTGMEPAGEPFLRAFAMDDAGMDVEVGWPVAAPFVDDGDVRASSLPAGAAAVASYFGPYDAIGPAYETIRAWCAAHGHEIAGPPWESYFTDPADEPDPARWRTDVHFPLRA